jgi:hypothetical protein
MGPFKLPWTEIAQGRVKPDSITLTVNLDVLEYVGLSLFAGDQALASG